MRVTFWQKIEEARKKGLTTEQFDQIENVESAIAYHHNKIDESESEIRAIEKEAKSRIKEEETA